MTAKRVPSCWFYISETTCSYLWAGYCWPEWDKHLWPLRSTGFSACDFYLFEMLKEQGAKLTHHRTTSWKVQDVLWRFFDGEFVKSFLSLFRFRCFRKPVSTFIVMVRTIKLPLIIHKYVKSADLAVPVFRGPLCISSTFLNLNLFLWLYSLIFKLI